MAIQSFQEIRARFPDQFLILLQPQEKQLDPQWIEVTGAEEVYAYSSGDEMLKSYKELKEQGKSVRFCTPDYTDRFTIEQIPTLGVFGG